MLPRYRPLLGGIAVSQLILASNAVNLPIHRPSAPPPNTSALTTNPPVPRIPGFAMTFQFDDTKPLRPFEVYQTAIQMQYDLAQRPWGEAISIVDSKQFDDYNVLILFINPQPPTAPVQLQVMHCVAALYRSISIMTDGVVFIQMSSRLTLMGTDIAILTIGTLEKGGGGGGAGSLDGGTNETSITPVNETTTTKEGEEDKKDPAPINSGTPTTEPTNPTLSSPLPPNGQITDPANPSFTLRYHFYGKLIPSKEISMAVLEALTAAAPFSKYAELHADFYILSPGGGCAILIDAVSSGGHGRLTYAWATRALKLMYQMVVAPGRRWGDVFLELRWGDVVFGEVRMLKAGEGGGGEETD